MTLRATATTTEIVGSDITFAVVVGDFFADGDFLFGDDENPILAIDGFAIGAAGMINVSGGIPTRTAVDIPLFVHVENIAVLDLARRQDFIADIFDHCLAFLEFLLGEESQTGRRSFDSYQRFRF